METLRLDLRYAARTLSRSPGFAAVAVLTLALGIGANAAIFSLVDATLLHPLPGVAAPERLVSVYTSKEGRPYTHTNYADYVDLRERTRSLSELAAFGASDFSLSDGARTARVEGLLVSDGYFRALGVTAFRGRTLAGHDAGEVSAEVVISHRLWSSLFARDDGILGAQLRINGVIFTVIGVAPPSFRGTELSKSPEIWIPLALANRVATGFWASLELVDYESQRHSRRRISWLNMVGRLAPDRGIEAARSELAVAAEQLERSYPQTNSGVSFSVLPAREDAAPLASRGELTRFVALLSAVVGFALLIACANLANLLLARATGRSREIAVRCALGASRARLLRQLLTESLTVALLGAGLGLLVATWSLELLSAFELPGGIAIATLHDGPGPRVALVSLAAALFTALAFGLAPALHATSGDVGALRHQAAGATPAGRRLRDALVVAQVALCLVLLIGAGLFLRSLRNGLSTDLGFPSEELLTASLELGAQGYGEERAAAFYRDLLARVEALPGVRAASLTSAPFGERAFGVGEIFLEGSETQPIDEQIRKHLAFVGPHYAGTMGLTLVRGRDLEEQDMPEGAPPVAVVGLAMARRYWPNQNPIGKRFRFAPSGSFFEIVGVVDDVAHEGLRGPRDLVYVYLPNAYERVDEMSLVVRVSGGDPLAIAGPLREQVRALDPDLPLFGVMTVSERVAGLLGPQRLGSLLLSSLGALDLLLAAVGIYGVVAFSVGQRTREIGIRIALGAGKRRLLLRTVREGLRPAMIGLALGLVVTAALARLASSFLYGLESTDPITYVTITALLAGVAGLSAYVPARRATTVDPVWALRQE